MTPEELNRRFHELEDVREEDVRDILSSGDSQQRLLARAALAKSSIRMALEACGNLAAEQGYSDQNTVNAVQRLVSISDIDEPYIETLKRVGIQAAERGAANAAMQYLQEAVSRGFAAGQRKDARSRRAMRYAHDPEIAQAVERLASFFSPPLYRRKPAEPIRLVILCSAVQDEDGPSVITWKRTEQFRDLGYDVEIVSTEMASSSGSEMLQRIKALGVPFTPIPQGTWEDRIRWMLRYFSEKPADTVCYLASAVDQFAILAACIGLSPLQSWDTRALEPQAGKFDLVIQGVSEEQELKTRWPGKSKFVGLSVAMADEIDAAEPLLRSELGLPGDAVVFGTFGRMEKCATGPYLDAMAQILAAQSNAWLVLAGRDGFGALQIMQQHFSAHGVLHRVKYLGQRQKDGPRLLKTIDVYCDTYPWPGGQTLLDAMQAGVPIVAMRRSGDRNLDPTGEGSTTALADVLLSGVVDLAQAGDAAGYARLALAYAAEPDLRKRAGSKLRDKAVNECNMRESTRRYSDLLRERLSALAGLV